MRTMTDLKTRGQRGGGETQARTHDRPLGGDSEIVRGGKSKERLGEDSHQRWWRYRRVEVEVKGAGRERSASGDMTGVRARTCEPRLKKLRNDESKRRWET